jgi:hypothetical protein
MQHLEHDDRSWRARVLRHFRLAETVEMGIRSLVPIYAPTPLLDDKSKFHGVIAFPPIPIDQQSLVALFCLSPSSHRGVASLGIVPMVGLVWVVACNLIVLPRGCSTVFRPAWNR